MVTKTCDNYDEAVALIKKQKKECPNFKGSITISFESENKFAEDYEVRLAKFTQNALTNFINRHTQISEENFPKTKVYKMNYESDAVMYARYIYEECLNNILYKKYSTSNTELFISSIYNRKDSPCYLKLLRENLIENVYLNKALVHEFNNRLVCVEVSPTLFYFSGDKKLFKLDKILDAEQIILRILTKIFDISYNREEYGY